MNKTKKFRWFAIGMHATLMVGGIFIGNPVITLINLGCVTINLWIDSVLDK